MFKYSKFPSCQILKSSKFSYHQNFKSSNPQSPEITKFSKSSNYQIRIHLKSSKYSNPLKLQILSNFKSSKFSNHQIFQPPIFWNLRNFYILESFRFLKFSNPRNPLNSYIIKSSNPQILQCTKSYHKILKSTKFSNYQILISSIT